MKNSISGIGILRQVITESSYGMKLLWLFIVMGISFVLVTFVAMLLAVPIFSISLMEIQNITEAGFTDTPLSIIRYFQAFQTLGLFFVPAILVNTLFFSNTGVLNNKPDVRKSYFLFLVVAILLVSIPFMQAIIQWNASIHLPGAWSSVEDRLVAMETDRASLSLKMLSDISLKGIIINSIIMAVIPAISEEFFFRGILQSLLKQWAQNAHIAIIITAVLFSAFHMQFYGFIPRLLLGILFGYLFYWSKTIWVPVAAHFINNFFAIVLATITVDGNELSPWLNDEHTFGAVFISIMLTGILIYLTRRVYFARTEI